MNIVLSAEDAAGIQALRGLVERGHAIVAVLAAPDAGARVGGSVWSVAQGLGVDLQPATRLRDAGLARELRERGADVLLNVHSLEVVHPEVLAALPLGGYNLHPSPLPRYAGLDSVSWAIYHGETEHGVTLHRMTATVDAGPIAAQARFPFAPTATALEVSSTCVRLGVPMVLELADRLAADPASVPAIAQDPAERSWFGRGVPQGGRLDWARSAAEVVDFVRACDYHPFPSPWGHPTTSAEGCSIAVVKAATTGSPCDQPPGTVGDADGSAVRVAARDAWVLVRTVRIEGSISRAADVLRTGTRLMASYPAPAGGAPHHGEGT